MTLRPPKARTRSRRGRTPIVRVSGRGSGRISMAALIATRPGLRTRLYYTTRAHRGRRGERRSFAETDYIALFDSVRQQLRAPIGLVWDRLNTRVSARMRRLIAAGAWLKVVLLSAYAPDLNPVEGVWSHVKRSLANLTAGSLDRLAALARHRLKSLQYRPGVLDGFVAATGLSARSP